MVSHVIRLLGSVYGCEVPGLNVRGSKALSESRICSQKCSSSSRKLPRSLRVAHDCIGQVHHELREKDEKQQTHRDAKDERPDLAREFLDADFPNAAHQEHAEAKWR